MNNPYFSLIKTVWQHGKAWRHLIVGYYIAYVIAQGLLGLIPYAFGRTIDLLQHFQPDRLLDVIFWAMLGVVLFPLFWVFHGPARVIERRVARKIHQSFLLTIYQKLTELPLKWHQDHHSGNLITCLNRAASSLKRFAEDQFVYIETIIKFLISIGFLLWISLPVGLMSLASCFIATLTVLLFDRRLIPLYEVENEVENRVGAGLFDYISNITTVLTLRLAEFTQTNIGKRLLAIWPSFNKEVVLNEVKWFSMGMVLSVTQSIILLAYILYFLKTTDAIMIGVVVMIFRYQSDLNDVFYTLSAHYSELVKMNTDVRGVNPILRDIDTFAQPTPGVMIATHWHHIAIHHLCFSHPHERNGALIHDMSLHIKRGEKIALIGSSGAGKSTLLNLLSGLYESDKVTLEIDNVAFDTLKPMHAITTLIPQEPELFENTILFNITMDLEAEENALDQVIELSCFKPVLEMLPAGLSTDIREKGLNLSVGQKQRLAMARGLFAARFSSLILMDEPTSSVDLVTEKQILSGMLTHYRDAAVIVSLHRLHLLPAFDRIILLDQGRILADGKASDMLKMDGPIRTLWQKYQAHPE